MRHKEYIALFEEIATEHPELNHSEKHHSFVRIIKSVGDPFEDKLYLEDFISRISDGNLQLPALIVMSYSHSYEGNEDEKLNKIYNGMYCIIENANKYEKSTTPENLDEALDVAEDIAESIIPILHDQLKNKGCCYFGVEDIVGEKGGPDTNNIVSQSIYFSFKKRTNILL